MSKEDFDLKEAIFEAIPEKEIKYPDKPVDVALQEAEDLFAWCQPHKELLVKAALDWKLVEDLPIRTGACRYAESQWQKESNFKKEAQKVWDEKYPVAKELRDELLHHFKHAYFRFPDILANVKKITEGSSQADMIQDLSDLSVLGKAHPGPLKVINIDFGLLDKADTTSVESAVLLAKANSQKFKDNKLRVVRDKTYLYLKEAVDEIRRCGQYVFWRDEARRKGYASKYIKKKNQKATRDTKEAEK